MTEKAPPEPSASRPRGRPRDPARMQRVLQAAGAHFALHGYAGASMEAIARDAGVSKMTVYSYFPTKQELFACTIGQRTDSVFSLSDSAFREPLDPALTLTRIGKAFLELMRDPGVVGKHRNLYGDGWQHPEAARAFWEQGPRKLMDSLAKYLAWATTEGRLRVPQPALAADQFLSMFLGGGHIQTLLGLETPSAHSDKQLLKANVALFLSHYGA